MPILSFQIMHRFKTTYYLIIYWYAEQTHNTIFFNFNVFLPETKIKMLCLITICTITLTNIIDNNILIYN